MTKKEYLRKGIKLKKQLEHDKEILKELQSNLDGLKALQNSEKLQGGAFKDDSSMVERLSKIIELERKIEKEICRLTDFRNRLLDEFSNIKNEDEKTLMESRYFLFMSWEQIANKLNYSLSHTFKLHGRALENFKFSENDSK